jgi:hypothetical protein
MRNVVEKKYNRPPYPFCTLLFNFMFTGSLIIHTSLIFIDIA